MRPSLTFLAVACLLGAPGCGSRTGLLVPDLVSEGNPSDMTPAAECADAGATPVYVVSDQGNLFSFDPATANFGRIGHLDCASQAMPFSMAVARTGFAYVVYNNGQLFQVSTANASCTRTPFVAGQQGFSSTFGMGFSANAPAPGETLFVASDGINVLGTIDLDTWALNDVGTIPSQSELTGTRSGELFAFVGTPAGTTEIARLDKSSGAPTETWPLPFAMGGGWAFAIWKGVFYTFTGDVLGSGSTIVNRFDPNTRQVQTVAKLNEQVVGAGVSTCAPEN
jgi:hypothetical protein